MGILNVTPDSFSDGGQYVDPAAAAAQARALVEAGADLVDVGAESSRPGAEPVSGDEELARLLPFFEALNGGLGVPISVDTYKPEVAEQVLASGAQIVNDISGASEAMLDVASRFGAPVIAMHMQGSPESMQQRPAYDDVVADVGEYLAERQQAARDAGVDVILDPGIGFGKTLEHNLALLGGLRRLGELGSPILVGTSRKSFLGKLSGRSVGDRVDESVASGLFARQNGAHILRVHDVAAHRAALDVVESLEQVRPTGESSTWVFAKRLEIYTRVGTTEAERSSPQPLRIDLEARLGRPSAVQDHDVDTTLDYVALDLVAREVCSEGANLLETLAESMATRVLERFPVREVVVRIDKPAVGKLRFGGDFGVELRKQTT